MTLARAQLEVFFYAIVALLELGEQLRRVARARFDHGLLARGEASRPRQLRWIGRVQRRRRVRDSDRALRVRRSDRAGLLLHRASRRLHEPRAQLRSSESAAVGKHRQRTSLCVFLDRAVLAAE